MLMHLPASSWLAAAIALAPAALRLYWGRPLVRLLDDPVLPERLAANQRRNMQALVLCFVLLLVGFSSSAIWAIPLLFVARGVAAFPLRRQLYGETWSLAAYLWFFGRLIVAMFGCWMLLATLPPLAHAAGDRAWFVAIALGIGLAVWNTRSAQVVRALLGVRPIADAVLLARFQAMAQAAGMPCPRFEYVDLKGGVIANAVAVWSSSAPGVIFTDTLLARLDAEEIVAICGHELAHLEHFNRARVRRLNLATLGLIAVGGVLGAMDMSRSSAYAAASVWPFLLLAFLIWRARDRQRHETDSDLRAVALCGDADALARALTKLHAFARLPRRWDAEHERSATHPSLARRLRDIHAAGGAAVSPPLDDPARFAAPGGATIVTLDRTHLGWQEGDAATHRFSYAHLTELRVDARPCGAPRLIAVEATGRRWEMPLDSSDVRRAQAALDAVDGALSSTGAPPRITPAAGRIASAIVAVTACAGGQLMLALLALVAAVKPSAQLLAAAGLGAVMAAAIVTRDGAWSLTVWLAFMFAMAGAILFAVAWSQRGHNQGRASAVIVRTIAALAVLTGVFLFVTGTHPVRVHQAARASDAAPVLCAAVAGAMLMTRTRAARRVALAAGVAAAVLAFVGSTAFLNAFGRDPFLVRAEPLTVTRLTGSPASQLDVPFHVGDLRVSPHGRAVAVSRGEEDEQQEDTSTFHVGRAAGPLTAVRADDVLFVDDDRLLTLTNGANGLDVREIRLDAPAAERWCVHVDALRSGTLSKGTPADSWQVLGWDRGRRLLRAQGRIGDSAVDVVHWNGLAWKSGWISATATSGASVLAIAKQYESGPFEIATSIWWALAGMRHESRVLRITAESSTQIARSLLDAECTSADEAVVCTAYDGRTTRLVRIDAATGTIAGWGSIDEHFYAYGSHSPGWVTGWFGSGPGAVRLGSRTAVRAEDWPRATAIAAGVDAVATASYAPVGSIVKVYRF